MQRELKFKAWDKKSKVFIKSSLVNNMILPVVGTRYGFRLKSRFLLLQYIGKKDKNGKEIYDGDTDGRGNVVEFGDGSFCLNGDRLIHSSFEIAGNIYENPELIKQPATP
jgi:hypothetical protein